MILKLKRTPGIYLVGFMACGKTTVGGGLAWELGWSFADIDEDIEAVQGIPIAQIFETRGEAEFRRIETAAIQERVRSIERGKPTQNAYVESFLTASFATSASTSTGSDHSARPAR